MKHLEKQILLIQAILILILSILLIGMIVSEETDMNTSVFAFIIYFAYILGLSIYNLLALVILRRFKSNWFYYTLPTIPGIIWLVFSNFHLKVHFWEFGLIQSIGLIFIWILINNITPILISKSK